MTRQLAPTRRSLVRAALIAAVATGSCLSAPRAPTARAPAPAPAPPISASPKTTPPPRFRCGPRDAAWEKWREDVLGKVFDLINGGLETDRLQRATGEARTRAESMLRRGIEACDQYAVEAISRVGWRNLTPDLERAVSTSNLDFRVDVIVALKELGSSDDFTDSFIAGLTAISSETRQKAAMYATQFSLDRLRAPLLARVRHDPSWFVRLAAAESLLDLADIYPRDLREHRAIYGGVVGVDPEKQLRSMSVSEALGLFRPLSDEEVAHFAQAADLLDAAITKRLAAGQCPKPAPLTTVIDLHILPTREGALALTVDESIGPCERNLAFVAFVQSAGGFDQWVGSGVSGWDPLHVPIETRPRPIKFGYARGTRVLTVGSLTVDTAKTNVVVVSVSAGGVVLRHQSKRNLAFQRHGRPQPVGAEIIRFQSEVGPAVRALLDRSPDLQALIASPP